MLTPTPTAKTKLLDAALAVIREQGYAATTVDQLCAQAGVTKGAFFHHFASKEELAVGAARYWSEVTDHVFATAPYQKLKDPLARVLGYIDFRRDLLRGSLAEFTCLVGTMVQESFGTSDAIRAACRSSIFGHSAAVTREIEAAKRKYAPKARWSAETLALHFQAVIQGAFILAKSDRDADRAAESIAHLRRYVELLFPDSQPLKGKPSR